MTDSLSAVSGKDFFGHVVVTKMLTENRPPVATPTELEFLVVGIGVDPVTARFSDQIFSLVVYQLPLVGTSKSAGRSHDIGRCSACVE
jgi:hypothetical protein